MEQIKQIAPADEQALTTTLITLQELKQQEKTLLASAPQIETEMK